MESVAFPRLGFHWVVDDFLGGCARPGDEAPLAEDLAFLKSQGVGAIVSIIEEPLDEAAVRAAGLDYLHLSCVDGYAPGNLQLHRLGEFVEFHRERGRRTTIHCLAGVQRTMTGIAAYLIAHRGASAADAITIARHNRFGSCGASPVSITRHQADALHEFALWRRAADAR